MAGGVSVGVITLDLKILNSLQAQLDAIAAGAQKSARQSFSRVGETAGKAMQEPVKRAGEAVQKAITAPVEKAQKAVGDSVRKTQAEADELTARINASIKANQAKLAAEKAPKEVLEKAFAPKPLAHQYSTATEMFAQRGIKDEVKAPDLSDTFAPAADAAELLRQKMANLQLQIESGREKLAGMNQEFAGLKVGTKAWDELSAKITEAESRLISLQSTLNATQAKIEEPARKAAAAEKRAQEEAAAAAEKAAQKAAKAQEQAARRAAAATEQAAARQKRAVAAGSVGAAGILSGFGKKAESGFTRFTRRIQRAFRSVFLMAGVYGAFKGVRTLMSEASAQNAQFSASLNAVKANLAAAFQPIYQAVLPALNAMMGALARVTQAIASFLSALFGKTYAQSLAAAKKMQQTAAAAKKAASGSKSGSERSVAGFDEIHVIQKKSSAGGSETGGINYDAVSSKGNAAAEGLAEKFRAAFAKINEALGPTKTALAGLGKEFQRLGSFAWKGLVDFYNSFLVPVGKWTLGTGLPSFINAVRDGMAKIDWGRINAALHGLWMALAPFAVHVGEGLLWFWQNVLVPLGTWTMNEVVPVFLNILAGAVKVVDKAIEALKPLGKWLWDKFLQPLAQWTGGVIVSALKGIADGLNKVSDWIGQHQQAVQDIAIAVGSFAAAWALVNGAITVWNAVGAVATGVTSGFGAAVAALTSPVGIAVLAIGAVIAIVVLLIKHWDEVKEAGGKAWDWIKDKWNGAGEWFHGSVVQPIANFFSGLWGFITGIFGNIGSWFKNVFSRAADGIRWAFSGIGGFFSNIWNGMTYGLKGAVNGIISGLNWMISGLDRIHFNIPDWLGGGSFGINISSIPYLAKGGIVDQPTLSMIGEAGKEAVVPLENNTGGLRAIADRLMQMMGGISGGVDYQKLHDTITRALRDSQVGVTLYSTNYELLAKGLMKVIKEYYGDLNIPQPV